MQKAFKNKPSGVLFYDTTQTYTNAVVDHLKLFKNNKFKISFYDFRCLNHNFRLSNFKFIIIHYSVRLPFNFLNGMAALQLKWCELPKILFIQDEYNGTDIARFWIKQIKVDLIWTTLPLQIAKNIYNCKEIKYKRTLTGYNSRILAKNRMLIDCRAIDIGYRGRTLPFFYGLLGQYKSSYPFALKKTIHKFSKLKEDIQIKDKFRIYGKKWQEYLCNCKSFFVSDSGSNIFDFCHALDVFEKQLVKIKLPINKKLLPKKLYTKCLKALEIPGLVNQISPKVFEVTAAGTLLISHPNSCLERYGLKKSCDYLEIKNTKKSILSLQKILQSDIKNRIILSAQKKLQKPTFQQDHFRAKVFREIALLIKK